MSNAVKLTIGSVLLVIGLGLVIRYFVTRPPDPQTADVETLGRFVMSDRFGEMSVEQRQPYVEAVFDKMDEVTPEVRERLGDKIRERYEEDEDAAQKAMMTFMMSMMANRARAYHEMTPEQKAEHLRKIRAGEAGGVFGNRPPPRRTEAERRQGRAEAQRRLANDDGTMQRQMNEIMIRMIQVSEPEDRAMMFNYFSDIQESMR